jgi:hypothetical protein
MGRSIARKIEGPQVDVESLGNEAALRLMHPNQTGEIEDILFDEEAVLDADARLPEIVRELIAERLEAGESQYEEADEKAIVVAAREVISFHLDSAVDFASEALARGME